MSVNDHKQVIENLGVSSVLFETLKETANLIKFKKKEVLINEDNGGADLFFLVKKGIARSFVVDDKGKEFTRTFYTEGMPLGSVRYLVSGKFSGVMFDCLTDCELYVGSYKELRKKAQLDLQVSIAYASLIEIVFLNLEDRIYELTLGAEDKFKMLKERIPEIENLIPQYQIASYLNVTNVQLSRVRKKLLYK